MSGETQHGGRLQGLVFGEHGQEPGEALRQHGLAGAGRSDHQQAVPSGSGQFERPLGGRLALHVAQVGE